MDLFDDEYSESQTKLRKITVSIYSALNKDFRDYYKKQTQDNKAGRLHEYVNDKIINLFWKKVGEQISEHRSGVYVENIGYFFNLMSPMTQFIGHIKCPRYQPILAPTENSPFLYWDVTFNRCIKRAVQVAINNGKCYINLMNSIIKTRTFLMGMAKWQVRIIYKKQQRKKDEI